MLKVYKTTKRMVSKHTIMAVAAVLFLATFAFQAGFNPKSASAACAPTTAPYGTVTSTTTVSQSGTYRVAVRMMAQSAANNAFSLDIGDNCAINVGYSPTTANTWTWVDYKSGSPSTKINLNLTAGTSYTVKMSGIEPGVKIDRVLLMSDTSCVPTGTGGNCYVPPDTTPPTTSLTAPAAGSVVKDSVAISANASDTVGISKVEFYAGNNLVGTDTSLPYSVTWNTVNFPDGSYSLTSKAFDTSGNATVSAARTVTVSNPDPIDNQAPSAPTGLIGTFDGANTVALRWTASSDNVGVTGYDVFRGGVKINTSNVNQLTYNDTSAPLGQTAVYTVKAKDAAGNISTSSNSVSVPIIVTPPVDDIDPLVNITAPVAGTTVSGTVNVAVNATDNVAVTKVRFYVDGVLQTTTDSTSPYTFSWVTTGLANGAHTIGADALDARNNVAIRDTHSVTVQNGDIVPPTAPTNVRALAPLYNKVNLSWTASTDAGGVQQYAIIRNGVMIATAAGTATTYSDATTNANTKYTYYLVAIDKAGNHSANSNTSSVTTPNVTDTQAPSVPTGLMGYIVSSRQLAFVWTGSTDNVKVTGYDVYRNGVKVATVTGTAYGESGLQPNTNYAYTVRARDAAGNVSANSTQITLKTLVKPIVGGLYGLLKDSATRAPLGHVWVSATYDGYLHTTKTTIHTGSYPKNYQGDYYLGNIPFGNYTFKYDRLNYVSKSVTVNIPRDVITINNVQLNKVK